MDQGRWVGLVGFFLETPWQAFLLVPARPRNLMLTHPFPENFVLTGQLCWLSR